MNIFTKMCYIQYYAYRSTPSHCYYSFYKMVGTCSVSDPSPDGLRNCSVCNEVQAV